MKTEVIDHYKEHELHVAYDKDCSTCFSEVYKFNNDE